VQYPKVKTFWDISSIVNHLLPHLWIQVIKRINLFSLQGSGQLVLSKGLRIHQRMPLFGIVTKSLFWSRHVSCIYNYFHFVRSTVNCRVPSSVIHKLLSIVLHPVCFVIDCFVWIHICHIVFKLWSLHYLWTNFTFIITIWSWSSLVWLLLHVVIVCSWRVCC